jgi:hypothetical protein
MSTEYDSEAVRGAFKFIKNAESLLVATTLALILWMGTTVYSNSIKLAQLNIQIAQLIDSQKTFNSTNIRLIDGVSTTMNDTLGKIEDNLQTIWPRLREIKERIQHLESLSKSPRAEEPWKY